ncbi:hypothetical protein RRX38_19390 [Pseudomonas sp. DTU_2021_1001937_2_SI_NGA_ILE_001]|uniref:hypothetical protein n=1 Tax=Pseudomonas sp. DTU_2021_1001937_2_SI_NGA_ILE_001 TaxID=3077589 RepID=UPI0028FC1169|nr:hypothetical protein [Pseudomonas sp. DTU_2021_1001937_2_SI_NGA_ILE_001]WNW13228.1 hypothetical protein RRX38_19390 [Pseudomonas sp. DTU_2021_1001937_2_SI_NGA_ILE_001]
MKTAHLHDMVKGWFVGDFHPVALRSSACEVAIKHYQAGDREAAHYHKVATEVTAVVSGSVRMADRVWTAGDIIVLEPGDVTAFEALVDTVTVVVKVPGVLDDKYGV